MIASLNGVVAEKNLNDVVIDVGGVGYRVAVSLLTLAQLPETGASTQMRIRTVVREDAFDLYGFLSRTEEDLFLMLTSVSHVGPKMALNVMSGLDTDELIASIGRGEVARLTRIHGVGKKTAERLVLELKDRVKTLAPADDRKTAKRGAAPASSDLLSALINLGYKESAAESAVQVSTERHGADAPFELLFREALKSMR